jgi:uncharacterized membrane protein YdjX (TVP38/TMEM64 family)
MPHDQHGHPLDPGLAPQPARRGRLLGMARLVAALVVLVGFGFLLRTHYGTIEAWLSGLGPAAPLAFLGIQVIAVPLMFPVSVLGFLCGALFGFAAGTGLMFVGGLASASIMFAIARGLAAERVRRYAAARPRLRRFLEEADRDSLRLMVLVRLSPLHFALASYLLGASRARFGPYLLATCCVLPSSALQAWVGHSARTVGQRAASGEVTSPWHLALLVVGIVAAVVLIMLLGRMARRALDVGDGGTT